MEKRIRLLLLLVTGALLAGCGTPGAHPDPKSLPGQVHVQLRFKEKDDLRLEQPASVYADGVLVGQCWSPGEVAVELPRGTHQIKMEIPWAWQLAKDSRHRAVALRGEQTLEVAGRGKRQVLRFDREHLEKKRLAD